MQYTLKNEGIRDSYITGDAESGALTGEWMFDGDHYILRLKYYKLTPIGARTYKFEDRQSTYITPSYRHINVSKKRLEGFEGMLDTFLVNFFMGDGALECTGQMMESEIAEVHRLEEQISKSKERYRILLKHQAKLLGLPDPLE